MPNDDDLSRVSLLDLLDSFTVKTNSMTQRVLQQGHRIKHRSSVLRHRVVRDDRVVEARDRITRAAKRLDSKLNSETMISTREKAYYVGNLVNILLLGIVLGRWPQWVPFIYSFELAVLLPVRFITYYRKRFHYYLADLCYYANLLTLLFLWIWPDSEYLYISGYSLSFGTLSFAIITWRNSLVLHSIDKTTSTLIHIMPPMVFHTLHFSLSEEYQRKHYPAVLRVPRWHVNSGLVYTTVAYFAWQTLYHYFITWQNRDKIKAGQITSFEHLRKSYGNSMLGKFVNSLPGVLPQVAFTLIQFGYQISTMMLCPLWYSSSVLSGLFLLMIFGISAYNGATYTIDIFGKRFSKEVDVLRKQLNALNEESPLSSPLGMLPSGRSSSEELPALVLSPAAITEEGSELGKVDQ